jgi:antirestriction protein ArdC
MALSKDIFQDVTDKMLDALNKNQVPWQKPWKGGGKNMPRNAFSKRPYRGINILILGLQNMMCGYSDNRWATFKKISENGGKVIKGSKSTEVVLWKPVSKNKTDAAGNLVMICRSYRVFNVEQTEGLKLPEEKEAENQEFVPIDEAEEIFQGYFREDYAPPLKYGFDHAAYFPSSDHIEMPDRLQFKTPEEFYATIFHEAAHSTLHEKRLNRKDEEGAGSHRFGSKTYAAEELVAEMSSAFLCCMAGIETTFDNSAAYIANWRQKLIDDPKVVVYAAQRAHKAVDFILDGPQAKPTTEEEE